MSLNLPIMLELGGIPELTPVRSRRLARVLRAIARRLESPDDLFAEPWLLVSDDVFLRAIEDLHGHRLSVAAEARTLADELDSTDRLDIPEALRARLEDLTEELQCCEDDEVHLLLSALPLHPVF